MSDSVSPQRRQLTRLPHPWDSPGKNTGVGCHFLLQCMKVRSESEVAQSCPTLSDPMDCSLLGSSVHGIFQARVLKWGAIAFSDSLTRYVKKFSMILILFNRTAIHEVVFSSYIPWFYQSLLRSKNLQAINAGEGVEKREPSYTVGGNAN